MGEKGSNKKQTVSAFGDLDKLLGIELEAKKPKELSKQTLGAGRKSKQRPKQRPKQRANRKPRTKPARVSRRRPAETISFESISAAYGTRSDQTATKPPPALTENHLPSVGNLIFPQEPPVGAGALKPMPEPFQNDSNSDNEFLMGIDFGTSNTKVVIRDGVQETRFVVEFDVYENEPCLLPSRLRVEGESCRFVKPTETGLPNLKFLIKEGRDLAHPVAYLAMVMRAAQQQYSNHRRSKGLDPVGDWLFNVGVPIAHWDQKSLRDHYTRVFVAATELAFDESVAEINITAAASVLGAVEYKHAERCQLVPELSAMLTGFVESRAHARDRSSYLLVDVGGGTVDFSVVNITQNDGDTQFWAFASEVKWLGVDDLEHKRVDWAEENLDLSARDDLLEALSEWRELAGTSRPVHPTIEDYFGWPQAQLLDSSIRGPDQEKGVELALKLLEPIRKRSIESHGINERLWYDMPLIMTGGGADLPAFRGFFDRLEVGMEKNVKWGFVRMARIRLKATNRTMDFGRFGVAFGLSFPVPGDVMGPTAFANEQRRQDEARDMFVNLALEPEGKPEFVSADQM